MYLFYNVFTFAVYYTTLQLENFFSHNFIRSSLQV